MNLRAKYEATYKMLADTSTAKQYKLVYEKNGDIYGSKSGIPAKCDTCLTRADLTLKPIVVDTLITPIKLEPIVKEPIKLEPIVEEPIIELPVEPKLPKAPVEVKGKRTTRSAPVETTAVKDTSDEEAAE